MGRVSRAEFENRRAAMAMSIAGSSEFESGNESSRSQSMDLSQVNRNNPPATHQLDGFAMGGDGDSEGRGQSRGRRKKKTFVKTEDMIDDSFDYAKAKPRKS